MADLTLLELARIVGTHPVTLRRLARMDELPGAYRLGGRWLIRREALADIRSRRPRKNGGGA